MYYINTILITSDDNWLIVAGLNFFINIWNLNNYQQISILKGHSSGITAMALTTNNKYLVTGGNDYKIIVWNLQKFAIEAKMGKHLTTIRSLIITNDNKYILSASLGTIRIWNFNKKTQESVINFNESKHFLIAATNERKHLFVAGNDMVIKVLNLKTRKLESSFQAHSDRISCITSTKDLKFAASVGVDCNIILWNIEKKIIIGEIKNCGNISEMLFTKNNKYLLTCNEQYFKVLKTKGLSNNV